MSEEARVIRVINSLGLEASFSTTGASLRSLTYQGKDLLLHYRDDDAFLLSSTFNGKMLGRVAGRIPNVADNGKEVLRFPEDEPKTLLHGGGMDSLSFKKFTVFIANEPEGNYVIFQYHSPDEENGFPGNLDVKVTYFLPVDKNEITVRLKASGDEDTPVNLSFHPYFNLDGEENIDGDTLAVAAPQVLMHQKKSRLPEALIPVPSCLDFTTPSKVGEKIKEIHAFDPEMTTLDHYFRFAHVQSKYPQVILESPKMRLEVFTDYEGANIYAPEDESDVSLYTNNPHLRAHKALAIEPMKCNVPFENLILKAGTRYSHFITYRFTPKEK